MTFEQEQKQRNPYLEQLKNGYREALEIHNKTKPELDHATFLTLCYVDESLIDLWKRVTFGKATGTEDLRAVQLVPGGRLTEVKNLRGSQLLDFNFDKFPVNLLVGDSPSRLFRPNDEIEISVTNRIRIHTPTESAFLLAEYFLIDHEDWSVNFRAHCLYESAEVLSMSLIFNEKFSNRRDSLEKALALSELTQWLYQVVEEKMNSKPVS